MKEGRGVASVASEGKESEGVEKKESEGVEKKESEGLEKNTLPQDKTSSQPITNDKKETKRLPPVDANGKPVSVDHHWKEFMKKSRKSQKKAEKKERVTSFFDDDMATVGTKKVPLRSK